MRLEAVRLKAVRLEAVRLEAVRLRAQHSEKGSAQLVPSLYFRTAVQRQIGLSVRLSPRRHCQPFPPTPLGGVSPTTRPAGNGAPSVQARLAPCTLLSLQLTLLVVLFR